jgi:protein tyrosine kinase modulator
LTRDDTTLQNPCGSLFQNREDSKITAILERGNSGEQFKVLDPAIVARRPFGPNRPRLDLMGAAGGLVIGLLLAGLVEYRDAGFKCEQDVARSFHCHARADTLYVRQR